MAMPFRLDGLNAVVTGGASGIGEATCRTRSKAGAVVTIVDVDRQRASDVARSLPGASVCELDITDEAQATRTLGALDRLDILVNNAGIGLVGTLEETAAADFRRLYTVNVEGTYLVSKACLPALLRAQGTIVNVASVAGMVGIKRRFAYCATKGAVIAMTKQLAIDYVGRIRVNCVCPGTVDTPFVQAYLEKFHSQEIETAREQLKARQPMGRMGAPDEIANAILYLCSREAAFVTGAAMIIDGGLTAG